MIVVERPLGNLATFALEGRSVERVPIPSDALAKRLLRLQTSRGELGLRLDRATLRPGDVVFADADRVVVVVVEPDDVLAIRPSSAREAFELGHLLGNLHAAVQWLDDAAVVAYDPVLERVLVERGHAPVREQRTLAEPFRHAHVPHGHPS